jgi:hypothetical protein
MAVRIAIKSLTMFAAALIIAELLLGVYYSAETGTLFWTRRVQGSVRAEEASNNLQSMQTPYVLSPYFGYVFRPGFSLAPSWGGGYYREYIGYDAPPEYIYWRANNYGFLSDRDYPTAGNPENDFIVGIFGSSVAQGLALDGRTSLIAYLSRNPALRGRRIVVLNFAGGGFKPPQQSLVLGYFVALGQHFDLIINMDGAANAYIAWENIVRYHVDSTMPAARLSFGLQNAFASEQAGAEAAAVERRIDSMKRRAATTRSALEYFWLEIFRKRLKADAVKIDWANGEQVAGRSYLVLLNESPSSDYAREIDRITDIWVRSSLEMKALAEITNAAYIQILEPNQWFGNKPLSDIERTRFASPTAPMGEIVPPMYKALLLASRRLIEDGVDFVDATAAFNDHSETIYYDWCCHFNVQGYRVLIDELIGPKLQMLPLRKSNHDIH